MAGSVLGETVLRKEDPKFLTTGGVYIDDFTDPRLDGAVHVVLARSPVAHGTIISIETSEAEGMPALGHLGVRHIDMPCTPEKVWRAIEAASN